MELDCTNPNAKIDQGGKLNHVKLFDDAKIVKIAFKNKSYKLFFQEYALRARKIRLCITFS